MELTGRFKTSESEVLLYLFNNTHLAAVREGVVVVVNRLGRNTVHTIQLVEEFNCRGVHFRALDLGIDSLTMVAKALEKGLSVAEIVTLTSISRASVKRYCQELAAAPYLRAPGLSS